jgi:D-serine deaminase-like pyridoxal phosphate-dependent protein
MSDVAGKVITSIVSHKKEKNLLLIDCGFTGLTVQSNGELPQGFCHIQGFYGKCGFEIERQALSIPTFPPKTNDF